MNDTHIVLFGTLEVRSEIKHKIYTICSGLVGRSITKNIKIWYELPELIKNQAYKIAHQFKINIVNVRRLIRDILNKKSRMETHG